MSLFETIRIRRSRPLFLEEHLRLLKEACRQRRFALDPRALAAAGEALSQEPDGVARLYVTAGDGPLSAPGAPEPRLFILGEERTDPALTRCRLTVARELHTPPFGGLKTGNYWSNADALQTAAESGCDEALLFNENSELVSAATANVFVLRGSEVTTPSLACGARDGVTRAWVMRQLQVNACSLFLKDLLTADAIFLTNSWYGVLPASSLNDRPVPAHEIGDRLARQFQEAISD